MLERGVDLAVRDVRLGGTDLPDLEGMKTEICKNALVLPNCVESVQIQLESIPVQPGSIETVSGSVRCIDKMSDADPSTGTNYSVGSENEMMVVKVCALMKPLFPTTRLGLGMSVDSEGNNAIVAVAAFVNEPGQRALEQIDNNDVETGGGLTTGGDA